MFQTIHNNIVAVTTAIGAIGLGFSVEVVEISFKRRSHPRPFIQDEKIS